MKYLSQLDRLLQKYLIYEAPYRIQNNHKEIIVKLIPWFFLFILINNSKTLISSLSFLTVSSGGVAFLISIVFLAISMIIEAIALPGLFKYKRTSWNLIFYLTLIGTVENLITFNIGGLIVGTILYLYILYQIKDKYI